MRVKKKKTFNRKSWIVSQLRRISYRYPARSEAKRRANVGRGLYKCEMCGKSDLKPANKRLKKKAEFALDHIEPVVSVRDGFINWHEFIERLLCEAEGYQLICIPCHDSKTMVEDAMRVQYDKSRKDLNDRPKQTKTKKRNDDLE